MMTSKTSIRYKLTLEGKIMHQQTKFKFWGIKISCFGDVEAEIRNRTMRMTRTTAYLNSTVWRNKFLRVESNVRIYKTSMIK